MDTSLSDNINWRSKEFPFRIWELVVLSVIAFIGICGNSSVIAVVYFHKGYRKVPFNIYLAGLATADFMVTLMGPVNFILHTTIFLPESPLEGTLRCKFVAFFFSDAMFIWSCYMLIVISAERYLAILYPIHAKTHSSTTKAYIVTILACIAGMVTVLPSTYSGMYVRNIDEFENDKVHLIGCCCILKWKEKYIERTVYLVQFFFQTAIPAALFLLIFFEIWIHLTNQTRVFSLLYKDALTHRTIKEMSNRRGKSAKTIGIIIIVFFTCWIPNRVFLFIFEYHKGSIYKIRWNSWPYQVGVVLIFLSSCLNPFIIAFRGRKFREALKSLIKRTCSCQVCRSFAELGSSRKGLTDGGPPYNKLSKTSLPSLETSLTTSTSSRYAL